MTATDDAPVAARRRPLRLQYSLRTLLVLITVVAVWLAIQVNRARKQQLAVQAIETVGGSVYYEHEFDQKGEFDQSRKPRAGAWARKMVGDEFFRKVIEVRFPAGAKVTDADLRHLSSLPYLEALYLPDYDLSHGFGGGGALAITDEGLDELKRVTSLKYLEIYGAGVTDKGIQELKEALPACKVAKLPWGLDFRERPRSAPRYIRR